MDKSSNRYSLLGITRNWNKLYKFVILLSHHIKLNNTDMHSYKFLASKMKFGPIVSFVKTCVDKGGVFFTYDVLLRRLCA